MNQNEIVLGFFYLLFHVNYTCNLSEQVFLTFIEPESNSFVILLSIILHQDPQTVTQDFKDQLIGVLHQENPFVDVYKFT